MTLCSIVIPVHNKAALTRDCVRTLLAEPPEVAHEIVVVDDASSDRTPAVLGEFRESIRLVRRRSNGGFATACNDGAAEAIAAVQADPARQRRAAREVAREYLRHDVVLADLLDHVGLQSAQRSRSSRSVGVAGRHQDRTQEASAGLRDSA
jgi:GT2 family glycosyltransferase